MSLADELLQQCFRIQQRLLLMALKVRRDAFRNLGGVWKDHVYKSGMDNNEDGGNHG